VSITELRSAINQLLGKEPVTSCVDISGDWTVTIDEVQRILNKHLGITPTAAAAAFTAKTANIATTAASGETIIEIGTVKANGNATTVKVPVTLKNALGAGVTSASMDIAYDSTALSVANVELGEASAQAEKEALWNVITPGLLRVAIIGVNVNELNDGVLAYVSFQILSKGVTKLSITPSTSNLLGQKGEVKGVDGQAGVSALSVSKGTFGMRLTITGTGFGSRGGSVLIGSDRCDVVHSGGWKENEIVCVIMSMKAGKYMVTVRPSRMPAQTAGELEISVPVITQVLKNNLTLIVKGEYFGRQKEKGGVTLTYKNNIALSCSVLSWTMATNTGASEIQCKAPSGYNVNDIKSLKIKNRVGSSVFTLTP
jgi:hypothetical protein